ncbi:hypothetical protein UJ101_01431 [Flavobacteriaceae bacterium UJ101]|nr:hypothetical protein UJ101_01431 [Flavobacteriaceae bacterium UJ101]
MKVIYKDNIDLLNGFSYLKEYVVYGVNYIDKERTEYLLINDFELIYPNLYSSYFFDIIDERESIYWTKDSIDPKFNTVNEFLAPYFFDNLINASFKESTIFQKYKELMDKEFCSNQYEKAIILDENLNWVSCSYCDNVFEIKMIDQGIIVCSKCNNNNNNPFLC